MKKNSDFVDSELKVINIMIDIYQKKFDDEVECNELRKYAKERLQKCKFGQNKPTCQNCKVHCYKPAFRQKVKQIMKYSGRKMLFSNPILVIKHFIKSVKDRRS